MGGGLLPDSTSSDMRLVPCLSSCASSSSIAGSSSCPPCLNPMSPLPLDPCEDLARLMEFVSLILAIVPSFLLLSLSRFYTSPVRRKALVFPIFRLCEAVPFSNVNVRLGSIFFALPFRRLERICPVLLKHYYPHAACVTDAGIAFVSEVSIEDLIVPSTTLRRGALRSPATCPQGCSSSSLLEFKKRMYFRSPRHPL